MIVVDASLAVKWMLWEEDSAAALGFLRRFGRELAGPDLVFVEVAGAIVRRANERKDIREDAFRAIQKWTVAWADHAVKTYRVTQRRLSAASALAINLGHPLKDCIYLALAAELDCDLATCDARFRSKAIDVYPRIKLLTDYID